MGRGGRSPANGAREKTCFLFWLCENLFLFSVIMSPELKEKGDPEILICNEKKVKEAVNALKLLNKKFVDEDLKKQPLLEDTAESPIYLQLTLKKIPPPQLLRIIRVLLPHSLVSETSEVCLITGDLEKRNHKAEVEPTILYYKDLLRKHGVTKVSEVIPLRQLRTEYKTFESRRQLSAAYDVFLVDKKIAGVMAKTLGKSFFQSRKFPVQIDMKRLNIKDQIDKALCQTEFTLTCRGNTSSLEIARFSMPDEAIAENIKACLHTLGLKLPGNEKNIHGLYLKTSKSKAIPIYVSLDIPDEILVKKPRKNNKFKQDELSTLDNAQVKVFRDGRVILKKFKNESKSSKEGAENDEDLQECSNESSLKKKKKKASVVTEIANDSEIENGDFQDSTKASRKKKSKIKKSADLVKAETNNLMENEEDIQDSTIKKVSPKKKKKDLKCANTDETPDIVKKENVDLQDTITAEVSPKKRKKGRKSILGQIDETQVENEEETQNSPSIHAFSKKKNKNRDSNYVREDGIAEDVQESSTLSSSNKQKVQEGDYVSGKVTKDKKRKVSEFENDELKLKKKKSKTNKNISEVAEEDVIVTTLKSKKEKKKAKDVNVANEETPFITIEDNEIVNEKTPLKSKKNKNVFKEITEDNTAGDSLVANVDSDINNSLVKSRKHRKSNRKSINVL